MSEDRIKVGILGAQPGRSWGAVAHLPALRSLENEFEVTAVANTSQESADAAASALGIPLAFSGVDALVACPEVDLVAVTVKVPYHLEAVSAALRAGKHVYCEWPLGNGLQEAEQLANLFEQSGCIGVVGMQARAAAEILFVRDLIRDGYIGDVLSTTISGVCLNWGGIVDQANAYTQDPANGASMLTIPFGHVMAASQLLLGDVGELSAILANRRHKTIVRQTGEEIPLGVPDQILVSGTLVSGAPISVHFRGDVPRGNGFSWIISGTEGTLEITGSGGNAQLVELSVFGAQGQDADLQSFPLPGRYRPEVELPVVARNIRSVYRLLADDFKTGQQSAPSFADAVRLHRLLDAVEKAAQSGKRVTVAY